MSTTGMTQYEVLQKCLITPETEVPQHHFLFQWHNTPCFARGELVAVGGKAKSGKTFLCSILMNLAGTNQVLCLRRLEDRPYRVLWIDTEQSEDTTHDILTSRIDRPDLVTVYNLRAVHWKERLSLVLTAITLGQYDLVIFDGIRDVVGDINDYEVAQSVVDQMLSVASWSKACIVCVLHQNKATEDKTLRGAIGTELMNKSYETYECRKEERILVIQQQATRKYDIPNKLCYTVNSNARPIWAGESSTSAEENNHSKINPEYMKPNGRIDKAKLMAYAFRGYEQLRFEQLRAIVMRAAWIRSYTTAGAIIHEAAGEGYLQTTIVADQEFFQFSNKD